MSNPLSLQTVPSGQGLPNANQLAEQHGESALLKQFKNIASISDTPLQCEKLSYTHVMSQPTGLLILQAAKIYNSMFADSHPKVKIIFSHDAELILSDFVLKALKKDFLTIQAMLNECESGEITLRHCSREEFLMAFDYAYPNVLKSIEPALSIPTKKLSKIILTLDYFNATQLGQAIDELGAQVRHFSWEDCKELDLALKMQKELQQCVNPAIQKLLKNEFARYFGMVLVVAPPETQKEHLLAYKEASLSALSFVDVVERSSSFNNEILKNLACLDHLQYLKLWYTGTLSPDGLCQFPSSLREIDLGNSMARHTESSKDWLQRLPRGLKILKAKCLHASDRDFKHLSSSLTHLQVEDCHDVTGKQLHRFKELDVLHLNSSSITVDIVKSFPNTIKKLSLKGTWGVDLTEEVLCHLPPDLAYLDFTGIITDEGFASLPRKLNTLRLRCLHSSFSLRPLTNKCLGSLPPGLTNLCLDNFTGFTDGWVKLLPRCLKNLIFEPHGFLEISLQDLPRGLIGLKLSYFTFDIKDLPSGLRNLEIGRASNGISDQTLNLDLLPRDLQRLKLTGCNAIVRGAFPPGLKHLVLVDCTELTDEVLRNLPGTLRSLYIFGCPKITAEGLKSLPRQLVHLALQENSNLNFNTLESLPQDLEDFLIHAYKEEQLSDAGLQRLPQRLLTISLQYTSVTNEGLKLLAPTLKRVHFNPSNQDRSMLPARFTHILQRNDLVRGRKSKFKGEFNWKELL